MVFAIFVSSSSIHRAKSLVSRSSGTIELQPLGYTSSIEKPIRFSGDSDAERHLTYE